MIFMQMIFGIIYFRLVTEYDDWDDRDSKGIWEICVSIYIVHLSICLYVFPMLATSPANI